MRDVIVASNLRVAYPGGVWALDGVDLQVARGEFLFLVGKSGSGKTTLFKALLGAVPIAAGNLVVAGLDMIRARPREIQTVRRRISVVFQDFRLFRGRTAYDNVALALRAAGLGGAELRDRTRVALEAVGLGELARRPVEALSWGQQQRVAVARAIVRQPEILLADEPTGNLDPETAGTILDLLARAHQEGATVLVATHDAAALRRLGHRTITLDAGRVASDRPPGEGLRVTAGLP